MVAGLLDAFLDVEEKFKITSEPGSDGPTTEQEAVDMMRKVWCSKGGAAHTVVRAVQLIL